MKGLEIHQLREVEKYGYRVDCVTPYRIIIWKGGKNIFEFIELEIERKILICTKLNVLLIDEIGEIKYENDKLKVLCYDEGNIYRIDEGKEMIKLN